MSEFTREDFIRFLLLGTCLDELGYDTSKDPSIDDSEEAAFEAFLRRHFPDLESDDALIATFSPEFESLKGRIIAAFRADTSVTEVSE